LLQERIFDVVIILSNKNGVPFNKRARKKGRNEQTLLEGRLKFMIAT
jgi:hypothetical protein